MNQDELKVVPIGVIHSPFRNQQGTPIQPATAAGAQGTVEVFPDYREGLRDLDGFERIWLVYRFHRSREARLTVVPYRDTRPHGVFATRAPSRPNHLGISAVRLLGVSGGVLTVADIDIIDGTSLLDIKPYVPEFDCFALSQSGWLEGNRSSPTIADDRFSDKQGENKGRADGKNE